MNPTRFSPRGALACLVSSPVLFATQLAFSQGSLTPPGPPTATMKSLAQIEARTPISSLPFTIGASGSYYLTQNLSVASGDAITITANQVSLDLNGFTISSTASPAAGTAVVLPAGSGSLDITIQNGHLKGGVIFSGGTYSGSGFDSGIASSPALSSNVRVSGVSVSGCQTHGINLGNTNTIVESCSVQTVGGVGIKSSVISKSTAYECGDTGIFATSTASDCQGVATGFGTGVFGDNATNCSGTSKSGIGLNATTATNSSGRTSGGSIALNAENANNCFGQSNSGAGISARTVNNCYGFSNTGRGISVEVAFNSYGVCANGGSFGINASRLANNCFGSSMAGTGLSTNIAIGCVGISTSGPPISYVNHYNMPP